MDCFHWNRIGRFDNTMYDSMYYGFSFYNIFPVVSSFVWLASLARSFTHTFDGNVRRARPTTLSRQPRNPFLFILPQILAEIEKDVRVCVRDRIATVTWGMAHRYKLQKQKRNMYMRKCKTHKTYEKFPDENKHLLIAQQTRYSL